MKKITREELLKSLGEMTSQLANAESRDSKTRATFTKLLRAYRGGWDGPSPGDTMNWMEIAFAIGILHATSEKSNALELTFEVGRRIQELEREILGQKNDTK